jgi:hypothetical protein
MKNSNRTWVNGRLLVNGIRTTYIKTQYGVKRRVFRDKKGRFAPNPNH